MSNGTAEVELVSLDGVYEYMVSQLRFYCDLVIDVHSEKCTQMHARDACHSTLFVVAHSVLHFQCRHITLAQGAKSPRHSHCSKLVLSCDVFVERPVSSCSAFVVLALSSVLKTLPHPLQEVGATAQAHPLEGVWSLDRFRPKHRL